MPDFDQYPESDLIKMIYMGDTGAGKTGSLCSLAAAGYNVRILDLDKGAQIVKGYVTDPISPYLKPKPGLWKGDPSIAKRMNFVTIQEHFTNKGGNMIPAGKAWNATMEQLTEWKDGDKNYGKLETWTPKEILVIDGLSRYCDNRMHFELVLNARAVSGRQQQDYFKVQQAIEQSLELLVSPAVRCHVILCSHVEYVEKDDKSVRGMPQAMGRALGPKIGQHFNHTLLAQTKGQGTGISRKILTQTTGVIDLKNANPLRVKPEYELESGLLEYFHAVLGAEVVAKQTGVKQ